MQVLFAVLTDLFRFAIEALFGTRLSLTDEKTVPDELPPLQPLLPLTKRVDRRKVLLEDHTDSGQYFSSDIETRLYTDPVISFDNVLTTFPYGTPLKVHKFGGRWAHVEQGELSGWVLKDALASSVATILPSFTVGSVYDAANLDTQKLRAVIGDEFSAARAELSLTSAEYVLYRLRRVRRNINWSNKRPRIPGQWQSLLRGRAGIHIGVTPKTDSIMEYVVDDRGHLLFVDAVFPDMSIQISGIDHEGFAVYSESVFEKEVWKELRPVFIEVL